MAGVVITCSVCGERAWDGDQLTCLCRSQPCVPSLTHAELAAYVSDLTAPELLEFAARVSAWRVLLEGTNYDDTRRLVIRALVAAQNGFLDRGWQQPYCVNDKIPRDSLWGKVHTRAAVLRADSSATIARQQIAAWARTVRLQSE